MTSQPLHSKLLTQAAKEILRPLGLIQRGRSRQWLDDHGWWLINVEFQPSAWMKGSYLNVGVQWLWDWRPGFYSNYGNRVHWNRGQQFIEFHDPEQFAPEARRLALLAADKVREYRSLFSDLARVSIVLRKKVKGNQLYAYHIPVAYGLLGQVGDALSYFDHAIIENPFAEWHYIENAHIEQLRSLLLTGSEAFRSHIHKTVQEQREALKLAPVSEVEIPLGATKSRWRAWKIR